MKRMLFTYRLWLLMTLLLSGSLSLPGQTVQPPDFPSRSANDLLDLRQGVTETELVTRALPSNPTLLAQRQQIAMAKGGVTQARLRKNPSLALGGLKEVNGGDNSFNVGGTLPLELYGRRARRTEVAQNKEDATQQSVADQERLLTGEVRTRFGEALASIRNLMFVEQLLRVNRDFLKLMEDRVREGATPTLDAEETRVEVNRIEAMRIAYQAKAEVALLALKEAVGIDPEESIRLKGELELAPLGNDQKQLLQLAMDHRPDLAFQRANEALANAELRLDKATAKPDASVFGGYQRPDSGFSQQGFDAAGNLTPIRQTFNYATFGLNIDLPLFNRNQGAVVSDTAAIHAARSQVAAVNLTLRHEVAQNLIRLNGAQTRVTVYGSGVRDQAAHNLDIVRQTYSYGGTTLLDVIAEQRRYIDIETGYLAMLAELEADHKKLERTENLLKLGAASQQEEEEVAASHAAHEAHVRAALEKLRLLGAGDRQIAALKQAEQINPNLSVPAPINGIVLTRTANPGLVTNMAQELFTVADLSTVWVMASINEKDFSTVHVGTTAEVTAQAYPGRVWKGRVVYIQPQVGPATRTAQARIEVANPHESLRLDMYMDVEFMSASGKGLAVPESAVQAIGEKQYVFLPVKDSDGSFAVRQVKLGPASNGFYPVLDGLKLNDEVVREGSFILKAEATRQHPEL